MDFVPYLLEPRRWGTLPPRWEEIFGRPARLCVEVGFGNGEFLVEMARRFPERNWVGFETSLTCIVKTGRRLKEAGVRNVRVALLDGKFGLRELFPDESVAQVFVNFPCPWPKARHASRRLVDESFAATLAAVLEKDGEFQLVTDARWYAEEAAQHLRDAGLCVEGPMPLPEGPGTRYEQKWRLRGLAIWRVLAKKSATRTVERIAEGTMPHAKIPTNFEREKIKRLAGKKETWENGAVVLKEVFFSTTENAALIRAFSTDRDFVQQFFLIVSETPGGIIVQLDGATVPFRTPAVKRAVALVAEELSR